jgi:Uma2 family endonuclease
VQDLEFPEGTEDRVEEARAAYASEPTVMTLEEYLVFEENSPTKHEFLDGVVYAMTNPTVAHERIRHNLVMALGNHLRRGPCQVFSSLMQLRIRRDASEIRYFPDIMVDCNRDSWGSNFVQNPKLIIEILSPSTHLIDRREKLQNCRLIGSVEQYVLVAQAEHRVTLYPRVDGWRPRVYTGLEAVAEFNSVALGVPLIEIYGDVLPA